MCLENKENILLDFSLYKKVVNGDLSKFVLLLNSPKIVLSSENKVKYVVGIFGMSLMKRLDRVSDRISSSCRPFTEFQKEVSNIDWEFPISKIIFDNFDRKWTSVLLSNSTWNYFVFGVSQQSPSKESHTLECFSHRPITVESGIIVKW